MERRRMTWRSGLTLVAVVSWGAAVAAAGCKEYGVPAGTSPHYEFNFIDMGDQPKVKAQRGDLLGGASFMPPLGAIARGFDPYPYHGQPELAAEKLVNPLSPGDPKAVERGKLMFERYCVPCHDAQAGGNGKVPEKGFPKPPSLMTQKVRDWRDGRIYHVISEGQNIMPSYASQIHQQDRWAIIRYVRQLQATQPVAPAASTAAAPADSAIPVQSAAPPASSAAPAVPSAIAPAGSAPPAVTSSAAPALNSPPPPAPGVPSREDEVP